jgi:haloacetate dehalogenase
VIFDGFDLDAVDVGEVTLRVRHGGSGPPVVLLHGHPRTHTTWYAVAPVLASRFTVVCPDLRGYGGSSKPASTDDHAPHSKRAMAGDVAALMTTLGHERFAVVGHDRGAYAALRTVLDHPRRVDRLAVLDAVPIGEALARCDATFARAWWHWFFFGQSAKPAERVIDADPDAWYRASEADLGADNYADFRRAIHDPDTVHAMLEDYRAGLGIDREHDDADRAAGRMVECPTLVLWALRDDLGDIYGDVAAVWQAWARDLTVEPFDSGHHMAEERPQDLADRLAAFLSA